MFELGRVVYTAGIASKIENQTISKQDLLQLLIRHNSGDWGDLCKEDKDVNNDALRNGGRLFSSYTIGNIKLYIITEHDHSVTTFLLPEEY